MIHVSGPGVLGLPWRFPLRCLRGVTGGDLGPLRSRGVGRRGDGAGAVAQG